MSCRRSDEVHAWYMRCSAVTVLQRHFAFGRCYRCYGRCCFLDVCSAQSCSVVKAFPNAYHTPPSITRVLSRLSRNSGQRRRWLMNQLLTWVILMPVAFLCHIKSIGDRIWHARERMLTFEKIAFWSSDGYGFAMFCGWSALPFFAIKSLIRVSSYLVEPILHNLRRLLG